MAKQAPLFASLEAYDFQTVGSVCFGLWKGYAVSIRLVQGNFWADFAVRLGKPDKALQRAINASLKADGIKRSGVNFNLARGKAASFLLRLNRKTPFVDQFAVFADACARALRENGLEPASTCAVCGGGTPESLCFVGTYQPVHASCMRADLEKTREKAEENQANGSYLTGLVGALLGMLVGLIPNVATAVFLDRIVAVLFALVPLAAMWGYRKFNGKLDKGSIGIIIVLSLIGVVLLQYFSLAIYIMQEYDTTLGLALSFTADLFRDGETLGQILSGSLTSFLFMGLGILFAWRYISQTNSGAVANKEALLSTMRPNPDFSQDSSDF